MNFGHSVQNKQRWASPFQFAPIFKSRKESEMETVGVKRDHDRSLAIEMMEIEGINTVGTYDFEVRREALFRTIFALAEVLEQIMSVCNLIMIL